MALPPFSDWLQVNLTFCSILAQKLQCSSKQACNHARRRFSPTHEISCEKYLVSNVDQVTEWLFLPVISDWWQGNDI
jgi:lysyl-tRNA synthetase class I